MLNIERVANQLSQLGADAQVRGLVDSGWFLESKQQRSPDCPENISCSPEDSIRIGLRCVLLSYDVQADIFDRVSVLITAFASGCGTESYPTDVASSTRKERSGSASLATNSTLP